MEYMKIEGQFPKFSNCAVTLGKFDGNSSWTQETDPEDPGSQERIWNHIGGCCLCVRSSDNPHRRRKKTAS